MRAAARTGKKLVRAVAERVAGSLEARYFVVRSDGRRLADRSIPGAQIRAALKACGTMIGANDLFIAAHARSLDLTLVTNNTDEFSRVEGLKVENWSK